jgi:hypothetical protein
VSTNVVRALAYRWMLGEPPVGDRVPPKLTARRQGICVYAVEVAIPDRHPPDTEPPKPW